MRVRARVFWPYLGGAASGLSCLAVGRLGGEASGLSWRTLCGGRDAPEAAAAASASARVQPLPSWPCA